MAQQSIFYVIRKDDRLSPTDADKAKIKKEIDDLKSERDNRIELAKKYEKMDKSFKYDENDERYKDENLQPEFMYLDDTHMYRFEDGSVWTILKNCWFSSTFSQLLNRFGIEYDGKRSIYKLSKKEAEEIRVAAKYLANGNYSNDTEELLSNDFIDVLKPLVPFYSKWRRNDGLCIFVDREDDNTWKITDGHHEWDSEIEEENSEGVAILKHLALVMSFYLDELDDSTDYDGKAKYESALIYKRC